MSLPQQPNVSMTVIAADKSVNTVPLEAANTSPGLNTSDATDTDVESIKVDDKEPWPTVKEFDNIYNEFIVNEETKCGKDISSCMYSYRSNLYPSHLPVDIALVAFQKHIDTSWRTAKKKKC